MLAPQQATQTGQNFIVENKPGASGAIGTQQVAKAKPGSVAFGSIGSGSLGHLAMAQIGNLTGLEFNHVPYKGGGPLMVDAVGGQIGVALGTVFLVNPHIRSGRLKPLAVTSLRPDPQLPGVPTVAEQGVRGFSALAWWGAFAPANTPASIQNRIHEEFVRALCTPTVADRLTAQGMDIVASSPQELDQFVRAEIERWAKVIQENKIRAGD